MEQNYVTVTLCIGLYDATLLANNNNRSNRSGNTAERFTFVSFAETERWLAIYGRYCGTFRVPPLMPKRTIRIPDEGVAEWARLASATLRPCSSCTSA